MLRKGGHFVATVHIQYSTGCSDVLTRSEEEELVRCARLPLNSQEVCAVLRKTGFVISSEETVGNSQLVVARKK